jgi:predicted XRE-type DNA-binding protein
MARRKNEEVQVVVGSGNVYADLGFPNPQEALAKAQLAIMISEQIKKKRLTQKKAAGLMGIDQPKVSDILRGKLSGFSIDRLLRFLVALGLDILIQAKPHTAKSIPAGIHILPPLRVSRLTA